MYDKKLIALFACALFLLSAQAAGPGSPGTDETNPVVADPSGDADYVDLGNAWITDDDSSEFTVHLRVHAAQLYGGVYPAQESAYAVEFTVANTNVRYAVGLSEFAGFDYDELGPYVTDAFLYVEFDWGDDWCRLAPLDHSFPDPYDHIEITVPYDLMTAAAQPTQWYVDNAVIGAPMHGLGLSSNYDCDLSAVLNQAPPPQPCDMLTDFQSRWYATVGNEEFFVHEDHDFVYDESDGAQQDYELGAPGACGGGPTLPPPTDGFFVDAQGPYETFIHFWGPEATAIYGIVSNGVGPFGCQWSSPDPQVIIVDDGECTAFAGATAPGTYTLILDGFDADTPQATGTDVALMEVRYRTEAENETLYEELGRWLFQPEPGTPEPEWPDSDEDRIDDRFDLCAGALAGGADMDYDGKADDCDADMDGDGVPNGRDNCYMVQNGLRATAPYGSARYDTVNPGQEDSDGNGIGDACEKDKDGDGWSDALDNCPNHYNPFQADFDNDGRIIDRGAGQPPIGGGNVCDWDVDGDGVQDAGTVGPNTVLEPLQCRLNRFEWADTDNDGICDNSDPDLDGDGWSNSIELDLGTDPSDRNSYPMTGGGGEDTQGTSAAASVASLGTTGFILLVLIVGLLVAVAIVLTRRF